MATEQRKLVSIVFADVVGSTAFGSDNDPEAVRSVMGSYFERMKAIAETYGGTVEKFIGDAVMVVFGVPRLHDDDAERAVRAALAMRDAMADLNRELSVQLAARVGVNTGEAVAGGGGERQFMVTGDPVNVAARLQQGADAGEVVVGALTESLTRSAIEYEPHAPMAAKGKTEPLQAFRAIRARSAVPEQARGLPAMRAQLVGRQRELRLLLDTFERVRTERRAHLFTLVGNAGIGKSRLVGELLARIAASGGARVLRGRCLPYGQGITYWPLMEILRDEAGIASDDGRETALAKLTARASALAGSSGTAIASRLAVMLGLRTPTEALPEIPAANVGTEIAWAVREHLAAAARDPLVVVIDDLQWAEAAVFAIVEGLGERTEDAPLLLLCVARPTLLETHPEWAAGRANSATITLDALSRDETKTLISRLLDVDDLPAELRERVIERSEGNPLFVEEFLRMLIDEGRVVRDGERWRATASAADVRVPESIHALLAARIDSLAEDERRVLQVASIVGERFTEAEVRTLAGDVDITRALVGLRRAGLVLEDRESREPGRFRFKHLLMRDVAYNVLPKATRADLHEAFARELEREVGDRRDEYAEIVGYHVERAFALAVEVRAPRTVVAPRARALFERAMPLAERARRRLETPLLQRYTAAATAALAAIGDEAAAEETLRLKLLQASDRRFRSEYADARAAFTEAIRLADALGRTDLAAQAHTGLAGTLVWSANDATEIAQIGEHATEAQRLFRAVGDVGGEVEAGLIILDSYWASGDIDAFLGAGRDLYERARAAGDEPRELQLVARLIGAAANSGHLDLAAEYRTRAQELIAKLGARVSPWFRNSEINSVRREGDLVRTMELLAELEPIARAELDMNLLMFRYRAAAETEALERRRFAEAAVLCDRCLEISVRTGDRWNRAEITATRAICLAAAGDIAAAERLITDASRLADRGDVFALAYIAYCNARVLEFAGRIDEALAADRDCEERFAASGYGKGMWNGILLIDQARFLADIGRPTAAADMLARAEAVLPPQIGERAARLAKLKERITSAKAAR